VVRRGLIAWGARDIRRGGREVLPAKKGGRVPFHSINPGDAPYMMRFAERGGGVNVKSGGGKSERMGFQRFLHVIGETARCS